MKVTNYGCCTSGLVWPVCDDRLFASLCDDCAALIQMGGSSACGSLAAPAASVSISVDGQGAVLSISYHRDRKDMY
jgi:hypothetical protein